MGSFLSLLSARGQQKINSRQEKSPKQNFQKPPHFHKKSRRARELDISHSQTAPVKEDCQKERCRQRGASGRRKKKLPRRLCRSLQEPFRHTKQKAPRCRRSQQPVRHLSVSKIQNSASQKKRKKAPFPHRVINEFQSYSPCLFFHILFFRIRKLPCERTQKSKMKTNSDSYHNSFFPPCQRHRLTSKKNVIHWTSGG